MRPGALALILVGLAVVAQNVAYVPDPAWQPPPAAVSRPNPLAGKPQYAAGGESSSSVTAPHVTGRKGRGC